MVISSVETACFETGPGYTEAYGRGRRTGSPEKTTFSTISKTPAKKISRRPSLAGDRR
jgi:hypothetical protein